MNRKVDVMHQGEAQSILNAKVEIAKLENNYQVEIEDLKARANSQI